MKLYGIDTEKEYTDEELQILMDAAREKQDRFLRKIWIGTYVICGIMLIVGFIYQHCK